MPRAWHRRLGVRLGVLLAVIAAHWIAFGTLPVSLHPSGSGVPGRGMAATTVSVRIGPAPTPIFSRALVKPVISKMPAQPREPDTQANENPVPQTPGPDSEGQYGVSGMRDDDRPMVLIAPKPTRLKYDTRGEINGRPYSSTGELLWQHDEKTYEARMDVADLALGSRTQTSAGQLADGVLEPLRFEDRTVSEWASQFDHAAGKVRIGPNAADAVDADLTPGAQDPLSVLIQLATVFAGNADRLPAGSALAFQTVGAHASQRWVFTVVGTEQLVLPTGAINAIHLTREPGAEQDVVLDLWLAPETGYLPVRIRLSHSNASFIEQEWRATESP